MEEWRLPRRATDVKCGVSGFPAYFREGCCAGSWQRLMNSGTYLTFQSQAVLCVGPVRSSRDLPCVWPRARYIFLLSWWLSKWSDVSQHSVYCESTDFCSASQFIYFINWKEKCWEKRHVFPSPRGDGSYMRRPELQLSWNPKADFTGMYPRWGG